MKKRKFLGFLLVIILTICTIVLCYKYFKIANKKVDYKNIEIQKKDDIEILQEDKKDTEKVKDDKNKPNENINEKSTKEQKEIDKKVSKTSEYPALTEVSGEKITIGTSSKGYTIYTRSGVTYVDGIMIVNKSYPLPEDYIPQNTHTNAAGQTNTCNTCINEIAYQSFNKMKADAASLGLNIYIQSGYRPYSTQKTIYNRYVARDGQEAADTYSARPGSSEHQSGLCFDLNSISDAFGNTAEGKWVNENAHLYGFAIRFPKGKQNYTGYKYESWHLRYVGSDLAKKLYNNGDWLSLEEYYGLDSEYKD